MRVSNKSRSEIKGNVEQGHINILTRRKRTYIIAMQLKKDSNATNKKKKFIIIVTSVYFICVLKCVFIMYHVYRSIDERDVIRL